MMVYSSLDISVWILVAFTFERILSVYLPHKIRNYCTRVTSCLVIGIIVFIFLILNSHFMFGYGRKTEQLAFNETFLQDCSPIKKEYSDFVKYTWPWVDFTVFNLIPCLIFIFGNSCIALKVLSSRMKTRRVMPSSTLGQAINIATINALAGRRDASDNAGAGGASDASDRGGNGSGGVGAGVSTGEGSGEGGGNRRRRARNLQMRSASKSNKNSSMTAILILLNFMFLTTTTPVSVYFIVESSLRRAADSHKDYAIIDLVFTIVNIIMYVNNATNFILYCITGSRFRKELKAIFMPKKRNRVHPRRIRNQGARREDVAPVQRTVSTNIGSPAAQYVCNDTRV